MEDSYKLRTQSRRPLTRGWWFVSFIFPLTCAAFAPLANLFGVLSFCEPWVVFSVPAELGHNPAWTVTLNGIALGTAVIANVLLLMNFTHRIRYMLAQPITISFWYTSGVLQTITFSLTHAKHDKQPDTLYTQAYYYAVIACAMHFFNATLLLASLLPTLRWPIFRDTFPVYQPNMPLQAPQRTLMLQTLIFTLYLAVGGGIFAFIEGWTYLDGIYWTEYSLLTIGFGSDFLPTSPVTKIILVPYTAIGVFVVGLVIASIRALFVAQFRERIVWGKEVVHHQRQTWWRTQVENQKRPRRRLFWKIITFWHPKAGRIGMSRVPTLQTPMKWSKDEWEVMRYIKKRIETRRRYMSLLTTFTLFAVIWFGGAFLFWIVEPDVTEQAGKFTYPLSLYFTYVSLLTIGYGDVIPRSRAGRPFFVVWSLAAIPSMTLLISDIGDTFAKWVKEGPIETVFGRWLIGNVEEEESELSVQENEEEKEERRDGDGAAVEKKVRTEHIQRLDQTYTGQVRKAMMLLHAVRKVIRDDEHGQYTWEEWERWIKLLELDKGYGHEEGDVSRWTWLGDEGPLLASGESEKLWLLEKFRQKLDEAMESLLK